MSRIPLIQDKILHAHAAHIKFCVLKNDELWYVTQVPETGLRNQSITYKMLFTQKAPPLTEIGRVPTLHTASAAGWFTPTMAEVIAQIPPELLHLVIAFTFDKEINPVPGGDYHQTQTILYAAA